MARSHWYLVRLLLSALVAAMLIGCGGGGGGGGSSTVTTPVSISINWAARSRVVAGPSSAQSAVVTLEGSNPGGGDFSFTIVRDPNPGAFTGNYISPNAAKTGPSILTIRFYSGNDGTGSLVGSGSSDVTIDDKGNGIGFVAVAGTVATVAVVPNQRLAVGETKELRVEVRNSADALIAVTPGSVFWSVALGNLSLRFENALAVGLSPGDAPVVATVDTIESASANVHVDGMPSFSGIGTLGGTNPISESHGISADGKIAVGVGTNDVAGQAYRWTSAGGMVGTGFPTGQTESEAFAANTDGSVLCGGSSVPVNMAIRWTAATGWVHIQAPIGSTEPDPWNLRAISADGKAAVGFGAHAGGFMALRWTEAGGVKGLGWLAGAVSGSSQANGISSDGTIVVGNSTAGGVPILPYRWTEAGGMVQLPLLVGATDGVAQNISGDGTIIVGNCNTGAVPQATRWDSIGVTGLGYLPGGGISTIALACNRDGTVVVGQATDKFSTLTAFIWDAAHGVRSLRDVLINYGLEPQLRGWLLTAATGISADGRVITGTGFNPDGKQEAFVATLP